MTIALLQKCIPKATPVRIAFAAPHLDKAMSHYGITDPKDIATFLAQIGHESLDLKYTEEIASGEAYEGRKDLGNSEPGDGKRFKGRGYIQLTGRFNYLLASKEFGKSLEELQEWLETPAGASWSAAWFWKRKGLSAIATKPDSWRGSVNKKYKDLDPFTYCCVIVNGGYNGLEDRRRRFEIAKRAFGI